MKQIYQKRMFSQKGQQISNPMVVCTLMAVCTLMTVCLLPVSARRSFLDDSLQILSLAACFHGFRHPDHLMI